MKSSALGFVAVLAGIVQSGSAIMCYECNSAATPHCTDARLPDNLKRNCSEHDRGVTHTLCRKIVQHVDYGINNRLPESRVIRSCGWDESKYKNTCYQKAGYGGRQEVCSCTTDYCNSSAGLESSICLVASAILVFNIILSKS